MKRKYIPEIVRPSFEELHTLVPFMKEKKIIAPKIDSTKEILMANLFSCFMDVDYKMPAGKYGMFTLVEDIGAQRLQIGTPGGGYHGRYRSFKILVEGKENVASLGLNRYRYSKDRTLLCVAIENEKSAHHSLQLAIDDYLIISGNECVFTHKGSIGLGKLGSGVIAILRDDYVAKYFPRIISDKRFLLGSLPMDKLWYFDEEDMINLADNLISYAIIRDMYRRDALEDATWRL